MAVLLWTCYCPVFQVFDCSICSFLLEKGVKSEGKDFAGRFHSIFSPLQHACPHTKFSFFQWVFLKLNILVKRFGLLLCEKFSCFWTSFSFIYFVPFPLESGLSIGTGCLWVLFRWTTPKAASSSSGAPSPSPPSSWYLFTYLNFNKHFKISVLIWLKNFTHLLCCPSLFDLHVLRL